jgi:uncharacterized membrane protein YdjX (TVP38/TMEM64 family)
MASQDSRRRPSDWIRLAIPVVLVAVLVIAGWRLGYFQLEDPRKLHAAASKISGTLWLVIAFVVVYTLLAALAAPITPLAYGAGAVWGFARGALLVWMSSVLGALLGYLLANGVWADSARRLLGRHRDMFRDLGHGNAFLATVRMRLVPFIPFGVATYAAAIGNLSLGGFLLGTAVGAVPATIGAVLIADRVAAGAGGDRKAYLFAVLAALGLLLLSFAPTMWKKIRG